MSADSICLGMRRLCDLSWGDAHTRTEYSRLLAPWDDRDVAIQMASGQSSCALAICAALLIAEVDGLVRAWRQKPACDPLREGRRGRYDAIMYLEHLAHQRGVHRRPGGEAPRLGPATMVAVDGPAHVLLVVGGGDSEGRYETIEGGQSDPLNPRVGAENCTAIRRRQRRLDGGPGHWSLDGRKILYTADLSDLPTLPGEGMPWSQIGVSP